METIVRHRDEGDARWFLNGLVTTKATAAETGGAFTIQEHLVTAAANPPHHVHTTEEESFYVLDGEVELEVDGLSTLVSAGGFALAPRGTLHTYRVLSDTARMLVITSAAGAPAGAFEAFVRDASVPAPAPVLPDPAAPDVETVVRAAAAYGIDIRPL